MICSQKIVYTCIVNVYKKQAHAGFGTDQN